MGESVEPTVSDQSSPPPLSDWFGIWKEAVTKPSEKTYIAIAQRADVKTAYLWLILAFLIPNLISFVMTGAFLLAFGFAGGFSDVDMVGPIAATIGVIGVVLLAYTIFEVVVVSLITILSNAIAKAFGGVGDFRQLIYCLAAYAFPVSLAMLLLGFLSCVPGFGYLFSVIGFALMLYPLVLNVIATKAVHQIETWQAAMPSVLIVVLMAVVMACIVIAWVALAIPVFGQVFPIMFENSDLLPFPPGF